MTRASEAPAWVLEGLAPFYAPMLLEPVGVNPAAPSGGTMAAARVRWLLEMVSSDLEMHAAAVLARRGAGLSVELPDGRRGIVVRAWEPGRNGDGVTWSTIRATAWAGAYRAGAPLSRADFDRPHRAAVVDVELLDAPRDVVRVEIERVRIPAPAAGDVEAFIARKRDPRWKRPPVTITTQHDERRTRRGTAKAIGIGSAVLSGALRLLVIDQSPAAGYWWAQDQETGQVVEIRQGGVENLGPYFGADGTPLALETA